MAKKKDEKTVVAEATGTASSASGGTVVPGDIEKAMAEAAAQAQADGVTDPDEVRERMLAARKAVKAPPQ